MSDQIVPLLLAAIRAALSDLLTEELARVLPPLVQRAMSPVFLTKQQLKELTGWSDRQVEYKKAKGHISYIRRGRTVLFPTDEVYAYLEEGRVPARKTRHLRGECETTTAAPVSRQKARAPPD